MKRTMWAVGPEGDEGWAAVNAQTMGEAKQQWSDSEGYHSVPDHIDALRVESWDALEQVSAADWLDAGLSWTCTDCGEAALTEDGGDVIDGTVYCGDCKPVCETCNGEGVTMVAKMLPTGHSEQMGECPDCDGGA